MSFIFQFLPFKPYGQRRAVETAVLPIVFLSHQHRPEQTERHDEKERRHQIDERHGFDFRDAKARRHGQHAGSGMAQMDFPSVEAKMSAVKPSRTALENSSDGSPAIPSVSVLYQPKPEQQNSATAVM